MGDAAGGVSFDHSVPAVDVVIEEKQQVVRVRTEAAGWRRVRPEE